MTNILILLSLMSAILTGISTPENDDPWLWLEEVDGEKALEWVGDKNRKTLEILTARSDYDEFYNSTLEILNSDKRIASPSIMGDFIYNFWQDADHERGIWRRTPLEKYIDNDPEWEILLDMDHMSEMDGENWVFKGATGLYPDYRRFMVSLSRGGGDAVVIREFDVTERSFTEGGFHLPESKGGVSWIDSNTLLVATDFGDGSMTSSGYPRKIKIWKRGEDIAEAGLLFEGEVSDVGSFGSVISRPEGKFVIIQRAITFYSSHKYLQVGDDIVKLDIPDDAGLSGIIDGQLVISLKSEWETGHHTFLKGALVSADIGELIRGRHRIAIIVEPGERSAIESASATRNRLVVNMLTNVVSEIYSYSFDNGGWQGTKFDAPYPGAINIGSVNNLTDDLFFWYQNFLTPSSLYFADAKECSFRHIRSLPSFFDAGRYRIWQYEARSEDGTMIPYFVVGPQSIEYDGANPTLLNAYGGFEVSRLPFYSATYGKNWLEKGGVFVLANIRGGGEFGPAWHQAGLKENRQKVFDDFHAVAEDLIERNITSGRHLGIMGGSNGGLLVGVAFTQRPCLYGAVVCQVPLLDMKRYNKLLAGASWMGEYGDPDIPEEWEYIRKYSPYHNLKSDLDYPEVFFTTSTRDDRVHPGHARKMVSRMEKLGHRVYYFENTEGGHAGASTNAQRAKSSALGFSYLCMKLGKYSK